VQPHVDLPSSRIRAFVDFVNGRTTPYDDFGHGTHVAGIVAGSGAASASQTPPYAGAAPEVDIVALKVLDGSGSRQDERRHRRARVGARQSQTYNIRVVNLSLGHPVFEPAGSDPLVLAAESLVRQGIVVVASAGNMGINPRTGLPGYGGITSPANAPSVIAVGAVDTRETLSRFDDAVTDYSSRGPTRFDLQAKPDLVAPGHRAVSLSAPGSLLFENYPSLQVYGGAESVPAYLRLSGTSMAAPMVAGTAALMIDANPKLTANTVKAVLQFTSQRLDGIDSLTQGAGYLNSIGSVRLARAINPNVNTGQGWLRKHSSGRYLLPEPSDLINDERIQWSQNIVWGNKTIAGNAAYVRMAFWDDNIVWGFWYDNIVWGLMDDNIVWGMNDNIVWGFNDDNIVWGMSDDNIVWGHQRRQHRLGHERQHRVGLRRQHRLGHERRLGRQHRLGLLGRQHRLGLLGRQHRLGHGVEGQRRQHRLGPGLARQHRLGDERQHRLGLQYRLGPDGHPDAGGPLVMEKMPYQPELDRTTTMATTTTTATDVTTTDWRTGLPVLAGDQITLRELRLTDAPSLLALLTTEEVARFISPPPTTGRGLRTLHRLDAP
jgi:hypothetical protein